MKKKRAFSLAEIMITVVVVVVIALPIISVATGARKDTAYAINYLRAVELGNELLDLVHSLRFEQIDEATINTAFGGSITDSANIDKSVKLLTRNDVINESLTEGFLAKELEYPEQYARYYFFRKVEVVNISEDLKCVKVTVYWADWKDGEGMPKITKIDSEDGRNSNIVVSTIYERDRNFSLQ